MLTNTTILDLYSIWLSTSVQSLAVFICKCTDESCSTKQKEAQTATQLLAFPTADI